VSITRHQPDPIHGALVARVTDRDTCAANPQALGIALARVLQIAHHAEWGALRWEEDQLPVPEWVAEVRQVIATSLRVDRPDSRPT
jgi:hypothetical protein